MAIALTAAFIFSFGISALYHINLYKGYDDIDWENGMAIKGGELVKLKEPWTMTILDTSTGPSATWKDGNIIISDLQIKNNFSNPYYTEDMYYRVDAYVVSQNIKGCGAPSPTGYSTADVKLVERSEDILIPQGGVKAFSIPKIQDKYEYPIKIWLVDWMAFNNDVPIPGMDTTDVPNPGAYTTVSCKELAITGRPASNDVPDKGYCGDGSCGSGETPENCAYDCKAVTPPVDISKLEKEDSKLILSSRYFNYVVGEKMAINIEALDSKGVYYIPMKYIIYVNDKYVGTGTTGTVTGTSHNVDVVKDYVKLGANRDVTVKVKTEDTVYKNVLYLGAEKEMTVRVSPEGSPSDKSFFSREWRDKIMGPLAAFAAGGTLTFIVIAVILIWLILRFLPYRM